MSVSESIESTHFFMSTYADAALAACRAHNFKIKISPNEQTNMIFRPLALAAAFAGSIGLSSAEVNYAFDSGEIISTDDLTGTVGVQLASKSEFCASLLTNVFLILMLLQNSLTVTFLRILFVFKSLHPDQRTCFSFSPLRSI